MDPNLPARSESRVLEAMAEEEEIGLEDLWRILKWRERERTCGGPWGNPFSLDRGAFLSCPALAHRGMSGHLRLRGVLGS